jgi:hypothetical protein
MGIYADGTRMSDLWSSGKLDTTTAEGNVNGQIALASFWRGKKSVIARECQASQGKPMVRWFMTEEQ